MPDTISQTNKDSLRLEIETHIASSARKLKWDLSQKCFDDEALSQFLKGWRDLDKYFASHEDISIGVDVVREYLYWTEKFLEVKLDQKTEPTCIQRLSEAKATLEYLMSEIIQSVDRRLYPEGR